MGLFSKKQIICPICQQNIVKVDRFEHWLTHVRQIPPGQGDASGQYTWECVCGPAELKWPRASGAAAGLGLHMEERHAIPLLD
jgi:hypothetical protein